MKLTLALADQQYQVLLSQAQHIAIPLEFNGPQPCHFGAPAAQATAINAGDFVGDTRRGGSCNVEQISLIPHCNGTHTECVGHITDERLSIHQLLADTLVVARLITVSPQIVSGPNDDYRPPLEHGDQLISQADLADALVGISDEQLTALIIRTLPNESAKQSRQYDEQHYPPFISNDGIRYLNQRGVRHLLVDFPSIDRMHDDGQLSSHHLFWQVAPLSRQLGDASLSFKTITEMVYVDPTVADGLYLLNLQISPFELNAAPSRPILIPLIPN